MQNTLQAGKRLFSKRLVLFTMALGLVGAAGLSMALAASSGPPYKILDFTSDPQWEAYNNRPATPCSTVGPYQFGYSRTNYVNGSGPVGELGGIVPNLGQYRSYYAKKLNSQKNLSKRLVASGSLVMPTAHQDATVMVGWFNANSTDWRANNFLGMRITDSYSASQPNNAVFTDFATRSGLSGGNLIKDASGYSGILPTGTKLVWTIDYQPTQGAYGGYTLTVTTAAGSYNTSVNLSKQQRDDGAAFDYFGIYNMQFGGTAPKQRADSSWTNGFTNPKTIYLDDLTLQSFTNTADGYVTGSDDFNQTFNFNTDPGWRSAHNNDPAALQDCWVKYRQDFGWSSSTNYAGGAAGEIGGIIWMGENGIQSYYADTTSTLGLTNDVLYASGKLVINHAHPDSDVPYIGWFNQSTSKWGDPAAAHGTKLNVQNMIGARIGGASSQGHNLEPTYWNFEKQGQHTGVSLSVEPKTIRRNFWICYIPNADAAGNGRLTTFVDAAPNAGIPAKSASIVVKAADKTATTSFDRFGMITPNVGSAGFSEFYLDNLRYTVAPGDKAPTDGRCNPPATQ